MDFNFSDCSTVFVVVYETRDSNVPTRVFYFENISPVWESAVKCDGVWHRVVRRISISISSISSISSAPNHEHERPSLAADDVIAASLAPPLPTLCVCVYVAMVRVRPQEDLLTSPTWV